MRRYFFGLSLCFIWVSSIAAQLPATPQEAATQQSKTDPEAAKATPDVEKPLPRIDDLIAKAKALADANEKLRNSYTCKQTVVADEFDSHGNKKGSHTDEYQSWTVQNNSEGHHLSVTVNQHIAHDGKPLSGDQAQKEQARVDKVIASVKDGSHKQSKGGFSIGPSKLLKVVTFSNERRTMVNGRPTIQFDYKGNRDAKTSDISEEVMKKLSGELWLDEEDAAIVRLNGKLNENFHVAGGLLVNVKAGSWFEINTSHINGEIWFLQHMQAHADGRFLLFKGFDGDANISFSDYRKMKTSVTILPGSQVIGEDGKPIPNLQVEPEATPAIPQPPGVPKQ